jgi:hypothetical protein
MIKKMGMVLAMFSVTQGIAAQVTLQASVPAAGMIQKAQLWNLLVVNSSTRSFDCRLEMVLRDRASGQEVMTATTGQFMLTAGAKQLNANLLAPVQYNYLNGFTGGQLQGLLPVGTYTACYSLWAVNIKENALAEECVPFDAEPLNPPMLSFPADSARLDAAPMQFNWLPPMPAGMFTNLQYEMVLTEISEGQKAAEAVQDNLPLYSEGSLLNNALGYTAAAPKLETGKWYAWQVTARDNSNYAGKSEVWVFTVVNDTVAEIINMAPYIKLAEKPGEVTTVQQGMLKMEYYNYLTDSVVQVWVYDSKDRAEYKRAGRLIHVSVKPGQNYLGYDLGSKLRLQEQVVYEAMLLNSAGQKFYMKFQPKYYR